MIGTFVCIVVNKIDNQLKISWLSTFIDKFNFLIDKSSSIDLSTTFSMIDYDRHITSCWLYPSSPTGSSQTLQVWGKHKIWTPGPRTASVDQVYGPDPQYGLGPWNPFRGPNPWTPILTIPKITEVNSNRIKIKLNLLKKSEFIVIKSIFGYITS